MSQHRILSAITACVLGAAAAGAQAIVAVPTTISSTFDTDADGWSGATSAIGSPTWPISSTGHTVTYVAGDGVPAGAIHLADPNSDWTYFRAPGKFLGNLTDYFGGTLSFDTRTVVGGTIANEAEVVLMGGGLVLTHEALSSLPSTWTSLSVSLKAGAWRVSDTFSGRLATDSEIRTVLGSLSELWINAEYYTPLVETIGLDNVMLRPVPEPSQAALLLAGVVLLGWRLTRARATRG